MKLRQLLRDGALLLLAAIVGPLGILLGQLDASQGPRARRVNIRWAPAVGSEERSHIEQERGLRSALDLGEARTWSYLLADPSTSNIAALLRDPRVEDTAHIDRRTFRVSLDRPNLDPRVLALLETDLAGIVATGLKLLALTALLLGRRAAIQAFRSVVRGIRAVLRKIPPTDCDEPPFEDATCSRGEIAVGIALAVLLLVPLLIYGPYDDEIVQATIMPNQVFYRSLFRGEWLYWLNTLGFGSPLPLGDPLMFHPVFGPLAAFASLRVTLSAVWIAHSVLMAVYFLRLLAVSGVAARWLRLVFLFLYLVSEPTVLYFYRSDWVQMAITWSIFPVLVFYMRSALLRAAQERFWWTAARLGLLFGFWVINAHPGYIIPLALLLAVYTIAAAPLDRRVYLCLVAGGIFCVAIASARIYTLLHELRLFPYDGQARSGGAPSHYIGAFLAPYVPLGNRGPFIGLGVAAALAVGRFRLKRFRDPHLRGCAAALVASVAFNLTPEAYLARLLPAVGGYLFRDGITFFSLLLAGRALQAWISSPRAVLRVAAIGAVVLQLFQQTAIEASSFTALSQQANALLFYRHQGHPVGLARVLVDRAAQYGSRVYLSPIVNGSMRRDFSADGIHFSSDLVLHGLSPVNGWFKNVSMAALYPPYALMESTINGDMDVIRNQPLLDVLGVNLVLSTERESGNPRGLIVAERPRVRAKGINDLVLLANPTAWPQGVLLAPEAATLRLPIRDTCRYNTALCLDYAALKRTRLEGAVALEISAGRYFARVPPADRERLLFISALYRPEWEAMAGATPLSVRPVARAFLGIVVPPQVSDITVTYVPRTQIALTWFSNSIFFALVGVVFLPPMWRAPFRRPEEVAVA
jgi:hypothetical protein